jgi:carbon-monoxide dehydrogenase small subunit
VITVKFDLNGQSLSLEVEPERRLLDILRDDLGLVGAKPGCGIGRCGACMVWLDGIPANACLVMAFQLRGCAVSTIEMVAGTPPSQPVLAALSECGALQCGYCSPGLVMTMTYLNQLTPRLDADEATALCAGNICRCTGYAGIKRAVKVLFAC